MINNHNIITPLNIDNKGGDSLEDNKRLVNMVAKKKDNTIEEVDLDEYFPSKNGFDVSLEDLLSVEKFNKVNGSDSVDNIELL